MAALLVTVVVAWKVQFEVGSMALNPAVGKDSLSVAWWVERMGIETES
jgi:hypothetical protein